MSRFKKSSGHCMRDESTQPRLEKHSLPKSCRKSCIINSTALEGPWCVRLSSPTHINQERGNSDYSSAIENLRDRAGREGIDGISKCSSVIRNLYERYIGRSQPLRSKGFHQSCIMRQSLPLERGCVNINATPTAASLIFAQLSRPPWRAWPSPSPSSEGWLRELSSNLGTSVASSVSP